jgi:hypothetical protein
MGLPLPARIPTDLVTVRGECVISNGRILTQPRMERMAHSVLTSRVVLHIRAQAGDNPGRSDGLTELNTIHSS